MNRSFFLFLCFVFQVLCLCAQSTGTLTHVRYGFDHPQDSTRTKVWWFHGETETTREGITADLEAFKHAGVGGVVYYDQTHGKMEHALPAFSEEWWQMLKFASAEAKRLGLSFESHISNGFVAGGPWITPELSMKRLVATEQWVTGNQLFEGKLKVPQGKNGFYRDVAVLAFPIDKNDVQSLELKPKVSSNVASLDVDNLLKNGSFTQFSYQEAISQGSIYVNLEYEKPVTARSITYEIRPNGKAKTSATNVPAPPQPTFVGTGYYELPIFGQLEVSDDGIHYRKVCDLKPIYSAHESWCQKTIAFPAVKGKFFRLNLHDWWCSQMSRKDLFLRAVALGALPKLDQWEEKAGLYAEYLEADQTPAYRPKECIHSSKIINLTDQMDAHGMLHWNVPKGNWLIMRFAYVSTGGRIKHGRSNLMGLECDKLSAQAITVQWQNYAQRIIDTLQSTSNTVIDGIAMDSHEAGAQNWTDDFMEQFKSRQGYNPICYLPALWGYVVDDVKTSDGFLFDVRRNIADMMADNYYGTIEKLCRQKGVTFTAQAIGNALCIAGDPIMAKGRVSKPQGEFWGIHPDGNYDIKESSSAAHLYGKAIASAEAFTDVKFNASLAFIKSLADYAYAFGINEFVVCASAYQPWLDRIPGNTAGGRHYCLQRNNTFWNYSAPFWDYQSRNAYMLRQGKPMQDVCIYLGENAPVKILTYRLPDLPGGYDFDAFTADALHSRMRVESGRISLPDGVSYAMMILPRNGDITISALQKIDTLVQKGATIYGPKPSFGHSKKDVDNEPLYQSIVKKLWGDAPNGKRCVGKGRVYWGMPLAEAMNDANIVPDVQLEEGDTKSHKIYFCHRRVSDADIYFMDNHKDASEQNTFTFKARRKYAQLWDTVTGLRYSLPLTQKENDATSVKLSMAPRASFFIVLCDAFEDLPVWTSPNEQAVTTDIKGPWEVWFDEKKGGPGWVSFDSLCDWTECPDSRIKYYSGTAIYQTKVELPNGSKHKVTLDLHQPGFIAQVFVNQQDAGVVWCSPWSVDISKYVKDGLNEISIHVANSLINRMIYDETLPLNERVTFAYPSIVKENDPLEPSGLKKVTIKIE